MALIIVVVGQKGGAGKSFLARHLAVEWMLRGFRVVIVDADPQLTTLAWFGAATQRSQLAPFTKSGVDKDPAYVQTVISELSARSDVVIVDTAGSIDRRVGAAMLEADLLLVPCCPDPDDMRAMPKSLELVRYGQKTKPGLEATVVINKMGRTNLNKAAREEILECGLPVAKTEFPLLDDFKKAVLLGQGAGNFAPRGDAAKLIRRLADELQTTHSRLFPPIPRRENETEPTIEELMSSAQEDVNVAQV